MVAASKAWDMPGYLICVLLRDGLHYLWHILTLPTTSEKSSLYIYRQRCIYPVSPQVCLPWLHNHTANYSIRFDIKLYASRYLVKQSTAGQKMVSSALALNITITNLSGIIVFFLNSIKIFYVNLFWKKKTGSPAKLYLLPKLIKYHFGNVIVIFWTEKKVSGIMDF